MNRPILFLDIDGVLNDHAHCHFDRYCGTRIKTDCAGFLQEIVDRSSALVVLISTWGRYIHDGHMTRKGMEKLFQSHGLHLDIIDALASPTDPAGRSQVVAAAIAKLQQPVGFAVIDDLPLTVPRHVRPNPDIGLRPHHIPLAIKHLATI